MSQLFVYRSRIPAPSERVYFHALLNGAERGSCCRPPLNRQDSSYPCRPPQAYCQQFLRLICHNTVETSRLCRKTAPFCWFSCATSVAHSAAKPCAKSKNSAPELSRLERSLRLFTYRPRNARKSSLPRIILAISPGLRTPMAASTRHSASFTPSGASI